MGRTIPSYRIMLERELERWKRFQDFLRIDERVVFEDMMNDCRRRASAAGAACFPVIADAMFLTILFAHHKALKELCGKIDQINNSLGNPTKRISSQYMACNSDALLSAGEGSLLTDYCQKNPQVRPSNSQVLRGLRVLKETLSR